MQTMYTEHMTANPNTKAGNFLLRTPRAEAYVRALRGIAADPTYWFNCQGPLINGGLIEAIEGGYALTDHGRACLSVYHERTEPAGQHIEDVTTEARSEQVEVTPAAVSQVPGYSEVMDDRLGHTVPVVQRGTHPRSTVTERTSKNGAVTRSWLRVVRGTLYRFTLVTMSDGEVRVITRAFTGYVGGIKFDCAFGPVRWITFKPQSRTEPAVDVNNVPIVVGATRVSVEHNGVQTVMAWGDVEVMVTELAGRELPDSLAESSELDGQEVTVHTPVGSVRGVVVGEFVNQPESRPSVQLHVWHLDHPSYGTYPVELCTVHPRVVAAPESRLRNLPSTRQVSASNPSGPDRHWLHDHNRPAVTVASLFRELVESGLSRSAVVRTVATALDTKQFHVIDGDLLSTSKVEIIKSQLSLPIEHPRPHRVGSPVMTGDGITRTLGACLHPMPHDEWKAGFRTCEFCSPTVLNGPSN